jgi:hypothetical protein
VTSVAYWQALGLAGAVLLQALLVSTARLLAGPRWALAYPATIVFGSALLTVQGLLPARWSSPVFLAALVAAAALDVRRHGLPKIERPRGAQWLAAAALGLNALWAAFPAYRYDQWFDHLTIPKILVREGPLQGPMFNDHVYFTGSFEFFLTLPRWVCDNDVFNQCFANAFSWLTLCIGIWGAVALARELLPALPSPWLITCYAAFTLPEEEGILNAKPDVVLFVASLCVQVGMALVARRDRESAAAAGYVGFLLIAVLGLKVTWLLALAPLGASILIDWASPRVRDGWRERRALVAAAAGAALGTVAVVPFVIKNLQFFGNPLHPVQFGPFRSTFWGPGLAEYYGQFMGAREPARYFAALAEVPRILALQILEAVAIPLLILAVAFALSLRGALPQLSPVQRATARRACVALVAFGLLWPLAMPIYFFPRYYFPACAFVTALALVAMDWAWPVLSRRAWGRPAATALLLAAPLWSADLPRKSALMARDALTDTQTFMTRVSPFGPSLPVYERVNADRRRRFPGAAFPTRITLTDNAATYFLDGGSIDVGGREYVSYWHRIDPGCYWELLDALGVSYVASVERPFSLWPAGLARILPELEPLGADGRVYFVDPDLAARKARAPECAAGADP